MYYKPDTNARLLGHSEARLALRSIMLATDLDDSILATHGVFPVKSMPPLLEPGQAADPLPPVEIDGVWTEAWSVRAKTPEEVDAGMVRFADLKRQLTDQVDDRIAAIYARWMRFESEYTVREAAARAFAAGSYEGDPGVWVTSFATPAGLSAEVAADRIIEQADGLRAALQQLGAQRMAKYSIAGAVDVAAAEASYSTIIAQVNAIAGAL